MNIQKYPASNFQYTHNGKVECEIDHPQYGKIPYALTEEETQEAINNEEINIAAFSTDQVTIQQIVQRVDEMITDMLNDKARELGYDNYVSSGVYNQSVIEQYRNESRSLIDWASLMYNYVETAKISLTDEEIRSLDVSSIAEDPDFPQFSLNVY